MGALQNMARRAIAVVSDPALILLNDQPNNCEGAICPWYLSAAAANFALESLVENEIADLDSYRSYYETLPIGDIPRVDAEPESETTFLPLTLRASHSCI